MKRRWRALLVLGGVALVAAAVPVGYIETRCRRGDAPRVPYRAILPPAEWRAEARTWLTYPEWHIVHSADSLGRYLNGGGRPSGYDYRGDVAGFWRSYCAVNRVADPADAGAAKLMLYTIGLSFSIEMGVKAAWEGTIGRLAELASGWTSANDRYAAGVQQRYGAFMHETPWYAFPFGQALAGLWRTRASGEYLRHWERRVALSAEYGVKAVYATAIGAASGATLGRDQLTLRFVARDAPARIAAIDARLKPVARRGALTVVEAPRYAQFSDLLARMASRRVALVEIAGNDDIFLTALLPPRAATPPGALIDMPLGDRPGWRRVGFTVKVPRLLPTMTAIARAGGSVEHVHDY